MYGTVARLRPKSGQMDGILKLSEQWERELAPNVDGFVASYLLQLDRDAAECLLVVIFEDRESYEANAGSAEQDRWYREFREHLETDPVWEDGQIIYSLIGSMPEPTI